jgi:hypothetical protein
MSPAAHVTEIDALQDFRAALCEFRVHAREALDATALEIRRTFEWLNHQLKEWQHAVRQRGEEVLRAKNELVQRKYSKADGRGYTEQELALEKALQRLHEAEDKVDRIRYWLQVLPRAVLEYEGPSRQLAGMLDSDLAQGIILLEQKLQALEAYVTLLPPSGPGPPPGGAPTNPPPAPAAHLSGSSPTLEQAEE